MAIKLFANLVSFFVAGMLLLLSVAVIYFWPATYWLDVGSVRVFDAQAGKPVIMAVDRTIKRDFRGEWIASIRTMQNGKWVIFCNARGASNYAVDSAFPEPLTLKWWTYPDCNPLPAGKYMMRTAWVIKGDSFLPDKTLSADSNIFEVSP